MAKRTVKTRDSEDSSLEGVLERVVYFNEENNFTVAKLQVGKGTELATIVGNIPCPTPGETLRLRGEWIVDHKFGRQFRVGSCLTVLPSTIKGIERYLSSGLVPGIGPHLAGRLVAKFGIETLEAIDDGVQRLQEVDGIGPVRAERIVVAWQGQKQIRDIMIFLQGHGIGAGYSARIYRAYGDKAISVVKENPYRLALDISGIGFKTADRIARSMGIDPASQIRAEAGIIHLLNEMVSDGHVYYPCQELMEKAVSLLEVDRGLLDRALASLSEQGLVMIEICQNQEAVYLTPLHTAEVNVARRLRILLDWPKQLLHIDVDKAIEGAQRATGLKLAEMQKEALKKAIAGKVLVITGGPGTGKTTLVNSLLKILGRSGQRIVLASPTGRAAKRLSEITGSEAKTIHRLLEYSPSQGGFKRNEDNPLSADLVIVDEASMIDILLMNHLLKAIARTATLVLVGDVDQLPSVGPGNLLKDIIASGCVETTRLSEIFRQAQESLIVVNAHRVNRGQFPEVKSGKDETADFYFIERDEPEKVLELVKELCFTRLPRAFQLNPVDDVQVITPMHKGIVGVANLNAELQNLLNPAGQEIARGGRVFRTGDKVMQIKNNYDKDVFNGDIGRVAGFDIEGQSLQVRFEDRIVDYEWRELDELVLAYAISVHKSQGSEYPAVVVPVVTQHYIMLQRNLLYTAITRGKKLVVLVGSKRAIYMAVKNNKVQQRYTNLAVRLRANGIAIT